jgi:hypothetical protein
MRGEFFEFLASKGLRPSEAERTLKSLGKAKLLDLSTDIQGQLPYVRDSADSRFGFLASSTLSGAPEPCGQIACRLSKADELARFASLYADEVLIRDPFSRYSEDSRKSALRGQLLADLRVLGHLQPLIEAGLVGVAPTSCLLCAEHKAELVREEETLRANLDIAADILVEQYSTQLSFTYERTGFVGVRGPESLIPHGGQFVGPFQPQVALEKGVVREAVKEAILYRMLNPILNDVFLQDHFKNHYQYRYLTDRDIDIAVIDAVGGAELTPFNQSLLHGLQHVVPVVGSVDIETLVALRREEGEAFQVYRDALVKLLRDADLSTPTSIREAFEDGIQPELNKINLAASNARKLQKRELKRDVAINGGIVSIGLMLGLLQPAIGVVTAALGGLKTLRDLGAKVSDLMMEPAKVRENSFYFLWRLSRSAELGAQFVVRD